jgi:fructokinase
MGVDVGGTKIEAAVVDFAGEAFDVVVRERVATERDLGYEHVVETTRALVERVARVAGIDPRATTVGVGMPGSVTYRAPDGSRSDVPLVKNSNTTCLNGRPFRDDLARAIGARVAFANDANCFALAEAEWGAGRGGRVVFGIILGTGVGGGLVFRDERGLARAWEGAQGIAGEWGHVVLRPDDGPECYCGRRGCVETFLSGPAFEAAYEARTGRRSTLAELARNPDAAAREVIAERMDVFGRAVATVIDVVDPDVVVLGGGASHLDAFYTEGRAAVARWVFNDTLETAIVKHALGDSAGVLGAALLPTLEPPN